MGYVTTLSLDLSILQVEKGRVDKHKAGHCTMGDSKYSLSLEKLFEGDLKLLERDKTLKQQADENDSCSYSKYKC
jgi:hypothetical protein